MTAAGKDNETQAYVRPTTAEAPCAPYSTAPFEAMNVLLVRPVAPENPISGGDLRWWNLLNGQADILCFARSPVLADGPSAGLLPWPRIRVLDPAGPVCRVGRWGNDPAAFARAHRDLATHLSAAIAEYCASCANPSVIIGDHALALLVIPFLRIPFVFDATDSFTLYFLRRAASLAAQHPLRALNSLAWFRTYRAVEATIARHAALYIVPGEADRRCVLEACPHGRVLSIPHGTRWVEQPPIEPVGASSAPVIAFHGGMTWDPNRSSAAYLAKTIFPLVRRSVPQARLQIAGAPLSPALAALACQPGVEVLGFVADLRNWLRDCHVYAMPMTQGSGMKNKLIEAMAAGLPVVTNSLGAEALPEHCRRGIVIADGRQALARAIVGLLRDPVRCTALRAEARFIAEREFGLADLAARYRGAIRTVRLQT